MSEPHPRMIPGSAAPTATDGAPAVPREPREEKVDFRDVMPAQELIPPEIQPDPTLVELIAIDVKQDDRRSTDISSMLS